MTADDPRKYDSLRGIFAEIPELAVLPFEAWRITSLAGLTNRSIRVTAGKLDYVLRLPGVAAGQYLSRSTELHNARLAAEIDISPPVLFADADRGIMLLPYLTGSRHLTVADLREPDVIAKIAALLARLHGSGLVFENTMSAFPITDRYLAIGSDARLNRLRIAAKPLEAALAVGHLRSAPCHIDPNTANFLRGTDGRLRLIDWEFSAMCEPIWDLAGIAIEGRLDPAAEELLLIAYESQSVDYRATGYQGGGLPRSRYRILKTSLHLVAASWAKAELASDAGRPEIAALLDEHCTALETALADPSFTRLLAEPV